MDFGYKTITLKKGFKLQISLLSDFPGYVLTHNAILNAFKTFKVWYRIFAHIFVLRPPFIGLLRVFIRINMDYLIIHVF